MKMRRSTSRQTRAPPAARPPTAGASSANDSHQLNNVIELLTQNMTALRVSHVETRRVAFRNQARLDELAKRVQVLEESRVIIENDRFMQQQQQPYLFVPPTPPRTSMSPGPGIFEARYASVEPTTTTIQPTQPPPRVRRAALELRGLDRYVCPKCRVDYCAGYILKHIDLTCKAQGRC